MTDDEADYIGDCVFDDMAWFLITEAGSMPTGLPML